MKATKLFRNLGQSLWLDNITRDLLSTGTLKRYIATARRLASLHLPIPVVAVCPDQKTSQDLLFSYGIVPARERKAPASWPKYLKKWVRQHGLAGEFAILTKRPAPGNHQMEIVEL